MGDTSQAYDIIKSFSRVSDVTIPNEHSRGVLFSVGQDRFILICPDSKEPSSKVNILYIGDGYAECPHFSVDSYDITRDKVIPDGKYRSICLYESDDFVWSLFSFEEKIRDSIERLFEILDMSEHTKEKELQKEFLFYWNEVAEEKNIDVFLADDSKFTVLNAYQYQEKLRCVSNGVKLNDKDMVENERKKWIHQPSISVCYVPIIDNREIIPPSKKSKWGIKQILKVLYGKQINHISHEDFLRIKNDSIKTKSLIIVFGMLLDGSRKVFSVHVTFKSANKDTYLSKLQNDVYSVEMVKSKRCDYQTLSASIGNDVSVIGKKVLIVGAGSLGSYVASEVIKNGFTNVTLYDSEKLELENSMRWMYNGFGCGFDKTLLLKFQLENFHPEIHVNSINKNMNEEFLKEEIEKNDLIIFTIGNSDSQLKFNRVMKRSGCKVPVIFTWIEAGGLYSHILRIEYDKKGCFQCLYTDSDGIMRNNKANILDDSIQELSLLRNGCGGTRAPYGTAVLLRTTAVILDEIRRTFSEKRNENCLIDISDTSVVRNAMSFYERTCACCGDKST